MSEPCWFCGSVEGSDGSPPADDGDGIPYHPDGSCVPLPHSWSSCDECSHALPNHALGMVDRYSTATKPYLTCRECARTSRIVDVERVECTCEACVDLAWHKAVGGRSSASRRSPKEPRRAPKSRAAASTATRPRDDRGERLRAALAEPHSTEELASMLGVNVRTIRRDLASIGAVEVRDGKRVRWTLCRHTPATPYAGMTIAEVGDDTVTLECGSCDATHVADRCDVTTDGARCVLAAVGGSSSCLNHSPR